MMSQSIFNRVGDADRIGLDRAQVAEGLPSLRLAAGRLIEFAHDAMRRLFDRANFRGLPRRFGAVLFGIGAIWEKGIGAIWERCNAVSCSHAATRSAVGQTCRRLRWF